MIQGICLALWLTAYSHVDVQCPGKAQEVIGHVYIVYIRSPLEKTHITCPLQTCKIKFRDAKCFKNAFPRGSTIFRNEICDSMQIWRPKGAVFSFKMSYLGLIGVNTVNFQRYIVYRCTSRGHALLQMQFWRCTSRNAKKQRCKMKIQVSEDMQK